MRHDCHRRGCGRVIVEDLIERARSLGYHTILAASCEESVGSIALLKSMGFDDAGTLREVGCKFGRRFAVTYLQLMLAEPAPGSEKHSGPGHQGQGESPYSQLAFVSTKYSA